jgi:hypothetical protein
MVPDAERSGAIPPIAPGGGQAQQRAARSLSEAVQEWLRASETVIAGRPANAGRAYSAGSEIETSAAKKPMRRFLAFIPRKWRLARWQVLLGATATAAWWGYVAYVPLVQDPLLRKDPLIILFVASWVIPAWLVYWLFVIAVRRASANIPLVARALAEIAAFAAMIGVAMLVTYLFPERHFWHGEVSRDAAYSPVVFAATLISEVGMYISWRVLGAVTQASKPGPYLGSISIPPAPVIGLPREDKPGGESPAGEPPADVQEEEPPNLPARKGAPSGSVLSMHGGMSPGAPVHLRRGAAHI